MGGLSRMLGLGCVIALVVGCGGSEFSADGETGGSDAGADSSGSGGSGGSDAEAGTGGSVDSGPDAPANKCTSELFQQTCQSPLITTGNATCDQCGRDNCCSQTNTCLADQSCAQQLRCYLESCLGQSAFGCVPGQCPACLASTQIFFGVSTCLQTNCSPVCPMLIP